MVCCCTHPKVMTNMLKKVFNWSEVHLSEVTSYKIHTLEQFFLTVGQNNFGNKILFLVKVPSQNYRDICSLPFGSRQQIEKYLHICCKSEIKGENRLFECKPSANNLVRVALFVRYHSSFEWIIPYEIKGSISEVAIDESI